MNRGTTRSHMRPIMRQGLVLASLALVVVLGTSRWFPTARYLDDFLAEQRLESISWLFSSLLASVVLWLSISYGLSHSSWRGLAYSIVHPALYLAFQGLFLTVAVLLGVNVDGELRAQIVVFHLQNQSFVAFLIAVSALLVCGATLLVRKLRAP